MICTSLHVVCTCISEHPGAKDSPPVMRDPPKRVSSGGVLHAARTSLDRGMGGSACNFFRQEIGSVFSRFFEVGFDEKGATWT